MGLGWVGLLRPADHWVAVAVNNLGNVYNLKGDYGRSLPLFEQALDIDLRLYGPDHPIIAARWNNVGDALRGLGRYQEAKLYLKKALESDFATFGESHPKVVLRYTNLGRTNETQGDTLETIPAYTKALEILRESYPENLEQIDFLESKLKELKATPG